MKTFKSPEDLNKLDPSDSAYPVIKELIEDLIGAYTWEGHPYNPDWYGYIILIEECAADRVLDELWDGCTLLNIPWEGITLQGDFYIAISAERQSLRSARIRGRSCRSTTPIK